MIINLVEEYVAKKPSIIYEQGDESKKVDIVIPIKNREKFLPKTVKSLTQSAIKARLEFNIIIVENSDKPIHKTFCEDNGHSYIFIEDLNGDFNKSLCMNYGALLYENVKYVLFHDVDCLVEEAFFLQLFCNIRNKNANVLQCFSHGRLKYCDDYLTDLILNGEIEFDEIKKYENNYKLPDSFVNNNLLAPGGSIICDKNFFFSIGGFDHELFLNYAPEDAFFMEKVNHVDTFHRCGIPEIEMYHLNHENSHRQDNPIYLTYLEEFKNFNSDLKNLYIDIKRDKIR